MQLIKFWSLLQCVSSLCIIMELYRLNISLYLPYLFLFAWKPMSRELGYSLHISFRINILFSNRFKSKVSRVRSAYAVRYVLRALYWNTCRAINNNVYIKPRCAYYRYVKHGISHTIFTLCITLFYFILYNSCNIYIPRVPYIVILLGNTCQLDITLYEYNCARQ